MTTMGRHKSVECPPAGRVVHVKLGETSYEGTYTVNGSMLIVETLSLGAKRRQLTHTSPEMLARLLLAELVDERRLIGSTAASV